MSTLFLTFIVLSAVAILLILVLKLKLNAFIALLLTSIYVGLLTGMPLGSITRSIQEGMAGTLGFVATVVGLGAIFGQMLESSGGAESLAHYLVKRFGKERAPWAMVTTGFIVAIPIFLDVAFIILVPIVYALSRDTKLSLLYYAIPLLAGLAVTHSFIPPTPGPVAVADIINAPLGWVILMGFILGIPTAVIAGPLFGKYISKRIYLKSPDTSADALPEFDPENSPSFRSIALIISVPLLLILLNTVSGVAVAKGVVSKSLFTDMVEFIGHPFSALIIATLVATYLLCIRRGMGRDKVLELSSRALGPAGIIILITGAGGVLKQVLIDSGIGGMMAESMANSALPPILLAWMLAALVRVTQGSATVAMITAASIIAPIIGEFGLNDPQRALVVISIASGATLLSHVNDSGFWLVGKYLGMNERQTLQSWTVMETIIAFCGLGFTLLASLFF
ncbi:MULTISPECIES: gluconate:H+ symporter [Petrimonas]|jgi:Gnt-I system low-affinity gluconate transporter|uniref:Gluconate permease n=1 Tax=Petrimonas mucosa TaxID=1642646 RepID=A0A1G4G3A0_9BACT|nr:MULTISPECIES: gluconate:H+ symporter [Petrimonas]MDD3560530.1 gluconate:H+ symporter [Petrimonas mucosa]SCM55129.1 Gluconate permease [Petrimonas mucosa]SFU46878.1 Gnt-I system low-affinity gluconate transporter [Porphyromonadaceae bacterium KHP3R9]HHT30404.1 gluconate transporter [Petrimonas mucosa]